MQEAMRYQVYLDGKLLEDCVEANDEAGIAFVIEKDAEGRYLTDHSNCTAQKIVFVINDKIIKETSISLCKCPLKTKMLRGRVEFKRIMRTRHVWVSPSKD
jgi:hypothetical protein